MTYPFVASAHDYGPRGPGARILGTVVHMAEGGGTVGYLSRPNPNGVSVHYVVEYTGRVVQMLAEDHVNGSINPRQLRTTDDPPYTYAGELVTYGASAARAALGDQWYDPNRVTLGIEVEGFAATGPNKAQTESLVRLVAELHARYKVPSLAHRDFADYKACPGRRIDWPRLGGHGGTHASEGDMAFEAAPGLTSEYVVSADAGTAYYADGECTVRLGSIARDSALPYIGATIGESVLGGSRTVLVGRGDPPKVTGVYVRTADVGLPERRADSLLEARLKIANDRLARIRTLAEPV